ncbi:MAG: hypothetical protein CVV64_08500 [Candidatus Wallbacteria bacterium HGW-Wallbacteria-1]|jgi:hypothetical protein|uniref:TadE-like domain-containing protein n=1 Tax=Candidatus Wallbacteria bacterium HGW-Wallbacteria-1 TaxID=2013854 RepID=A0A2N1PPY3_9BACT|nr:MAG: hypothetical protein CVV64_08500 [Candidatus Wallbacteria bacterium HGW-Wallbacteria-1]
MSCTDKLSSSGFAGRKGQAVMELCLVLPIILIVLSAVVEWGFIFYRSIDLQNAVREGGRYAAKEVTSREAILNKVRESSFFDISRVWILPNKQDTTTGSWTAVTVIGEIDYKPITPLDSLIQLVTSSSEGFKMEYLKATSTFKFQTDFDPTIFDTWEAYNGTVVPVVADAGGTEPPPLLPSGPTSFVTSTLTDNDGYSSFIHVNDNGDSTTTYEISVTSDSDNKTAALSHIVFGLPPEVANDVVESAGAKNNKYPFEFVEPDPVTGVTGLKFDEQTLGEDGIVESETYHFTVKLPSGTLAQIVVATKSGISHASVTHDVTGGGMAE